MAKHHVSSIERGQKKKFKMGKKTKIFVIALAVLLVIAGVVYALSSIPIQPTGGVIREFSLNGENNSVPEIPGAKLHTGSLYKGLIFDMPLKIRYTKDETPSSEIMTDRTPYSNDGQNFGAIVGADYTTFDGEDDYVDCGDDESLTPVNISVVAWIYLKDAGANKHVVTHDGDIGSEGYMLGVDSRRVRWTLNRDWGGNGDLRTTDLITLNQWVCIVGTYDNSKMKIYVNGEINAEKDYSVAIDYSTALKTIIAASYQGTNYYFNGSISDVRIYNRVLSESEIKLLYDKGDKRFI